MHTSMYVCVHVIYMYYFCCDLISDPPIISGGPFFVFAPVGRPFTIPCGKQIEANPQPDYRWLYKGAAIPMSFNTTTLKDGGLLFYEAEFSQNGSYTCIAWNNLGEANITLTFFINSKS